MSMKCPECEYSGYNLSEHVNKKHKDNKKIMFMPDLDYPHGVGDKECGEGWCGSHYPIPCDNGDCKGLIHANFGDESYDGDYWCYTRCDVCGESE